MARHGAVRRIGPAIFGEVEADALQPLLGIEIARPFPAGDGEMDGVVLRRHAHHLRAAPGDRAHIGFLLAVLLDHQLLGGVDLGDRVGDFEVEHIGRALQPLGMLGGLEDLAAIGALALEHAARVMQAVAEHMQIGLVPGHQLAVVPDDPVEPVIGLRSHRLLLPPSAFGLSCKSAAALAAVMAHFPRLFQHFASAGNTRYEWDRSGPIAAGPASEGQSSPFGTILSF